MKTVVLSVLWGAPGVQPQKTLKCSIAVFEKLKNNIFCYYDINFCAIIMKFDTNLVNLMGKEHGKFGDSILIISMIFFYIKMTQKLLKQSSYKAL